MSLIVYAGGAQFTAVRLAGQGAAAGLLVVTAALINLRHILYGLSLAPHLRSAPRTVRWAAAFFLVDESYRCTGRRRIGRCITGFRAAWGGRGANPGRKSHRKSRTILAAQTREPPLRFQREGFLRVRRGERLSA
jgi:hypothetical protein